LKLIQKAMADPASEPQCRKLYETVGVYLGYGLAQYCEFYKIDHVMILGRVSKGAGGDLMLEVAKKVLETEFPEYAGIQFHTQMITSRLLASVLQRPPCQSSSLPDQQVSLIN